ncbi:gamma-glutamylcyclotransferase family protein [Roseovarius sp.]|uniref:gamma-glutamylcyclotransferase family protein n=1 Tax=Roseovarius sp. TaxID=1486281 RepID=UPI003A969384
MIQIKAGTKTVIKNSYFFGYGSLVNRESHKFAGAVPAQLGGWQRVWRHTNLRPVAYLTVVPDPEAVIDGLIAPVPDSDWPALDLREAAYVRTPVAHQVRHTLPHMPEIAVYTIPEGHHAAPTQTHPILLSYLDVVVKGYMQEFGAEGVQRFFDTTHGWEAPILNDRAKPLYPRHQSLSAQEHAETDQHLDRLGISPIAAP